MAMKTTAIINQKGGVAKTTTSLCLSEGLSSKGYRVLLVDLDPQGNLSSTFEYDREGYNALDMLEGRELTGGALKPVGYMRYLIPYSRYLTSIDSRLEEKGREYRLRQGLEQFRDLYDYCIIDTPPSLGTLTINALTASDNVVIPTQCDIYSLEGISQLLDTVRVVQRYTNPSLTIKGVLITQYKGRQILTQTLEKKLLELAQSESIKVYETRIRNSVAVVEAHALRKDLMTYARNSNANTDYKSFVNEFVAQDK